MLGTILRGAKKVPVGKFARDTRKFLLPENATAGEYALRVLPDVGFGFLAAASAGPEADLLDQFLIGGAQAAGGIGGGLAAGGLARKLGASGAIENLADMAGSIGGDMVAMNVGLGATALKDKLTGGEGLDPFQKMNLEQQRQMEERLAQQLLAGYGLIPGTLQDNFMAGNGLG